jgi:large repetitive protein
VNNPSGTSVDGVQVTDNLPTGVTYQSHTGGSYIGGMWNIGTLGAGTSATLTINATVNVGTGGSVITNTATISAMLGTDPNLANNTDPATINVPVPLAVDIAVNKNVSNPTPRENSTFTYTLSATNTGLGTATGVQITDNLPVGVTFVSSTGAGAYTGGVWSIATINPGQTRTRTITARVDLGTQGTTITNTATFTTMAQPDTNPANNSASVNIVPLPPLTADLGVTMTVSDPTPSEGGTVIYRITVTNAGPDPATSAQITDVLPAGLSLVLTNASQGGYGGNTWNLGTLNAGATATLDLTVVVGMGTAGVPITNTATRSFQNEIEPNAANDSASQTIISTPFVAGVDLVLTMIVSDPAPFEGTPFNIVLRLTNNSGTAVNGTQVTHILPTEFVISSTSGVGSYAGGIWIPGTILAGATVQMQINVTAQPGSGGSTVTTSADITAAGQPDPNTANNTVSQNITIGANAVTLTKTVSDPIPNEADTIVYQLTLQNNLSIDATNVQVTDALPFGVTFVSADQPTYIGNVWDVGTLPAGTSTVLNITVTVDAGTAGTLITNTADVTALDQPDAYLTDNTDSVDINVATVPPGADADLGVGLTVSNPTPTNGEQIDYVITVTNNGPDTASGIQVQDVLPPEVVFQSALASNGTFNPGTDTWTLISAIPNGGTATLTLRVVVSVGAPATTVSNTASISALTQTDAVAANDSATVTFRVLGTDITLAKSVDNPTPIQGNTVTWTITLTNAGVDDMPNGLIVTDFIPSGIAYTSHVAGQGIYNPGTGLWDVGPLPAGNVTTLAISGIIGCCNANNTLTNNVSITTLPIPDMDSSNNLANASLLVLPSANLTVNINDAPDPANYGDTIIYVITVSNPGPNQANTVDADFVLGGASVTVLSVSSSQGGCTSVPCALGDMVAGSNATITVTVSADTPGIITSTATVTSPTIDPNPGNNTTNATTNINALADISISTADTPDPVNQTENVTYTFTVDNTGPNQADNVTVDHVLSGAGGTIMGISSSQGGCVAFPCNLGTLLSGTNATITLTVRADNNGTIVSDASLTSAAVDMNIANNTANATTAVNPVADVSISSGDAPDPANQGDTVTYTFTVSNAGPSQADNVTVDHILSGVSGTILGVSSSQGGCAAFPCNLGTLAPSGTATVTLLVRADNVGTIVSDATVTTTTTDLNGGNNAANATTAVNPAADVSISNSDAPDPANQGDTVTYTFTVSNAGPSQADNVTVNHVLGGVGGTITGVSSSQGGCAALPCDLGTITSGGSATITMTVTADNAGTIVSDASVSSITIDLIPGNNVANATTTVNPIADVSISNGDAPDPANQGDAVTYTFTVSNAGPSAADNVTVDHILGGVGGTVIGVASSQGGCVALPCNLGTVPASGTAFVMLTLTADNAGTITSDATVMTTTTDLNGGNNTANATTTVNGGGPLADVSVSIADAPDPATLIDTIVYVITISNAGPNQADTVTVNHTLTGVGLGATVLNVTASQAGCAGFPCDLGTILAGNSATITVQVNVDNFGTLTSDATANSTMSDPNGSNNAGSASTTVTP